ncbi:MAG: ATP-binding cassette domain-containing protein, partial [Thermomicrobiales bacterium]
APGRWLAVTGPSGSGKSTFLTVLQAFLRPSAGRYCLNAQDTAAMRPETIRMHIAWCPQEAHLFDSSLRANLLLARSREDAPSEAEMTAALAQVGLGDLLADLPEGLETPIGPQGSHLSGGQRQRVAIARTVLTRASVLLIDEPTAHLDRESADALMADLRAGLANRIVVLVTHHAADLAPTDTHLQLA